MAELITLFDYDACVGGTIDEMEFIKAMHDRFGYNGEPMPRPIDTICPRSERPRRGHAACHLMAAWRVHHHSRALTRASMPTRAHRRTSRAH